jgi:serine protease Do
MPRRRSPRSQTRALPVWSGLVWLGIASYIMAPAALGQSIKGRSEIKELAEFSRSVQSLAERVSPSIVQVLVTRYGSREEPDGTGAIVSRQRNLGSGVIVDPDGYIMTNAHVVAAAQQIRVRLVSKERQTVPGVLAESYAAPQKATLAGVFKEADLALLKVEATGLPAVPFADYMKLRQGEVVFAFGSPEGLQNSMSMGVVSSIARQLDPDSPFLYIQTDAPINPGDSGGPLMNTAGEIVGLDTFIITGSGGSEGIGFAIPSIMVHWVFEQLRKYGHVHRPIIGVGLQTITPTLAAALKLPSDAGVVVSDVLPGSPAETAGLKIGDILLYIDGIQLNNVATLMAVAFQHGADEHLKVQLMRGGQHLSFDIVPVQELHEPNRLTDLGAEPIQTLIPRLGILAVEMDQRTAAVIENLRRPAGVIVAARVENPRGLDTRLQAGDVIHEINGSSVSGVEALQSAVRLLKPGDPVALLIERDGKLSYVAFQME